MIGEGEGVRRKGRGGEGGRHVEACMRTTTTSPGVLGILAWKWRKSRNGGSRELPLRSRHGHHAANVKNFRYQINGSD